MIKRWLVTLGLITTMTGMLVGCGGTASESASEVTTTADGTSYVKSEDLQLETPKQGDTVATLSVKGYGDIKVRFFDELAPKAVENFVTHAKEGYYDGVTFHRVINDFMIQGGDPKGDGTGGESIWGTPFENEIAKELLPIRGALCMANAGADTNGSQFFIVQASAVSEEEMEAYSAQMSFTNSEKEKFVENGGTPWLKGGYTVFGQVYEGMDVVDEIAQTATDDMDKPLKSVIIEKVTITEYEG